MIKFGSGRTSPSPPPEVLPAGVIDLLALGPMKRLHDLLEDVKEEETGYFSLEDFEMAMQEVLSDEAADADIREVFYKMDANSVGKISWHIFMDHILQIYNQRDATAAKSVFKPFLEDAGLYPCLEHNDAMIAIEVYATLENHRDVTAGNYVGASTEGFLMFWSSDLELIAQLHIQRDEPKAANQSVTVTDMACIPDAHMIAVSTTVWDIRFYDSSPAEFERHFSIVEFPTCVMSVDYHMGNESSSLLVCGDTGGGVSLIWIKEVFFQQLRRSQILKQKLSRIPYVSIERRMVDGLETTPFLSMHSDWVLKVKYIYSINSFLSCATCTKEAMALHDISKAVRYFFRSPRGILTFDFSYKQNLIISGGMDYNVKLWNPYVKEAPTCTLQGHMAPVAHILVDDERHFIMSVSKDKYIKVWHLTLHNCLQTLNCSDVGLGAEDITAAIFHPQKRVMIVATYQMAVFKALILDDAVKYNTHSKPVCAALYNKLFNLVITGGQDSDVMVWELMTGRKVFEFSKAHKVTRGGVEYPVEITAMRLEPRGTRLVTAGKDGVVKIWNFNNGLCLNEFRTVGEKAITGIAFAGYHMFVAGWNRQVSLFYDDGFESFEKVWDIKHSEDILGIDTHRGQLLVTAAYDGEIIVWIRENGFVKFRLKDEGSTSSKAAPSEKEEETEDGEEGKEETEEKGSSKSSQTFATKISSTSDTPQFEQDGQSNGSQSTIKVTEEQPKAEPTLDKIMFLQHRPIAPDVGTLVSCGKDGIVRMWSVAPGSGLLGKFHAAHRLIDAVLCMASDSRNRYLITGDTSGYLRVWQLEGYCDGKNTVPPERRSEYYKLFSYLRLQSVIEQRAKKSKRKQNQKFADMEAKEQMESEGNGVSYNTKSPCLLNSFRGHLQAILHVEYVDGYDLMLSCGREGSVRMWSVCGTYIGTFGQRDLWDIKNMPVYPEGSILPMPADVRRLASPTTFKVINKGSCPRWNRAMEILTHAKNARVMTFPWVKGDDDETEDEKPTEEPKVKVSEDETPILGKFHVIRRRYHKPPQLPPLVDVNLKISLFHCFDIPSLDDVPPTVLSDYDIVAIQDSGILKTKRKKGRRKRSVTFGTKSKGKY